MSNESVVVDHPERLGRPRRGVRPPPHRLRRRRRRASSCWCARTRVVVDVGDDARVVRPRRSAAIGQVDERQAGEIRKAERRAAAGIVAVGVPNERADLHPQRAALERRTGAAGARPAARGRRHAEPNHVVLGSQSVRGVPVGGETYFAGGMMFTADIVDTASGRCSRRRPIRRRSRRGCPSRSRSPATPAEGAVLDTGLRTVDGTGAEGRAPVPDVRPAALAVAASRRRRRHRRRGRVRRRQQRHARLRGRPRHVHHRHHPADLPRRRGPHRRRAVELRRRRRGQRHRRVRARRRPRPGRSTSWS